MGEPERDYYSRKIRAEIDWLQNQVNNIPDDKRRSVLFVSSMDGYTGTGSFFDDMSHYMGIRNAPSYRAIRHVFHLLMSELSI